MIPLGRIFGFPLSLDFTALVVLGLFVLGGASRGPSQAGFGLALAGLVFGSILVHELGHAFAARRFQLGEIDITLHGFGGLTRFKRAPGPKQGLLVTLAGPFAGLAAGVVALVATFFVTTGPAGWLLAEAARINLLWSVFNLLPMYPLDGGSVLFHTLSLGRRDPRDAMLWTARVGVVVAVGVGYVAWRLDYLFVVLVCVMSLFRSLPAATTRG